MATAGDAGGYQLAVREHAVYLGFDPDKYPDLLSLAEEALGAALPQGWTECQDATGNIYYFHTTTSQSSWEHPLDAFYRSRVAAAVLKKEAKPSLDQAMLCAPSKGSSIVEGTPTSSPSAVVASRVIGLHVGALAPTSRADSPTSRATSPGHAKSAREGELEEVRHGGLLGPQRERQEAALPASGQEEQWNRELRAPRSESAAETAAGQRLVQALREDIRTLQKNLDASIGEVTRVRLVGQDNARALELQLSEVQGKAREEAAAIAVSWKRKADAACASEQALLIKVEEQLAAEAAAESEWRVRLEQARGEVQKAEEQAREVRAQVNSVRVELSDARAHAIALSDAAAAREAALVDEIALLGLRLKASEACAEAHVDTIHVLKREYEAVTLRAEALGVTAEGMAQDRDKVIGGLQSAALKNAALAKQLAEQAGLSEVMRVELAATLASVQKELDFERDLTAQLRAQASIADNEAEFSQLRVALQEARDREDGLNAQVMEERGTISRLLADLEQVAANAESLRTSLDASIISCGQAEAGRYAADEQLAREKERAKALEARQRSDECMVHEEGMRSLMAQLSVANALVEQAREELAASRAAAAAELVAVPARYDAELDRALKGAANVADSNAAADVETASEHAALVREMDELRARHVESEALAFRRIAAVEAELEVSHADCAALQAISARDIATLQLRVAASQAEVEKLVLEGAQSVAEAVRGQAAIEEDFRARIAAQEAVAAEVALAHNRVLAAASEQECILRADLAVSTRELQRATAEAEVHILESARLAQKLATAERERAAAESSEAAAAAYTENARVELLRLAEELESVRREEQINIMDEMEALCAEREALRADAAAARLEANAALQREIDTLKHADDAAFHLCAARERMAEFDASAARTRAQVESSTYALDRVKAEREEVAQVVASQIDHLEVELASVRTSLAAAESMLEAKSAELATAELQATIVNEKHFGQLQIEQLARAEVEARAEATLRKKDEQLAEARSTGLAQVEDLQRAVSEKNTQVEDLKRAVSEKETQVEDLKRVVSEKSTQVEELHSLSAQAQTNVETQLACALADAERLNLELRQTQQAQAQMEGERRDESSTVLASYPASPMSPHLQPMVQIQGDPPEAEEEHAVLSPVPLPLARRLLSECDGDVLPPTPAPTNPLARLSSARLSSFPSGPRLSTSCVLGPASMRGIRGADCALLGLARRAEMSAATVRLLADEGIEIGGTAASLPFKYEPGYWAREFGVQLAPQPRGSEVVRAKN